ncbi:DUF4870 domain-containing protein [Niallia sp. 03190]|uniref:DUF4870 domain-containing protein n=1 Tax=Niallia sp. 03190 TaxID=3458061 RepID=UPI004044836E
MNVRNVLASLCYFSVFVIPIIFPIAVLLTAEEKEVKVHAKKGLLSQLTLFIPILIIFIFAMLDLGNENTSPFLFIPFIVISGLLYVIVFIWNLVKGIKLLLTKEI